MVPTIKAAGSGGLGPVNRTSQGKLFAAGDMGLVPNVRHPDPRGAALCLTQLAELYAEQVAGNAQLRTVPEPSDFSCSLFMVDHALRVPEQWVALTSSLLDALHRTATLLGPSSGLAHLMHCSLEQRPEHVRSFSNDGLNRYSDLYFRTPPAPSMTFQGCSRKTRSFFVAWPH
jgi:hypothetical protein